MIWLFSSCSGDPVTSKAPHQTDKNVPSKIENSQLGSNDSSVQVPIASPIKQVPVLCYHRIVRGSGKGDLYSVGEAEFLSHLKMLGDSGYQTILPDDLYHYLTTGKPYSFKPVLLSFDDTRIEHYTIAAEAMKKYGFKGVFFIMNISIGKPGYMNAEQIKSLSDSGQFIGCHTWDHHRVQDLQPPDWKVQVDKPKSMLENITGKPVVYFSYPYGIWSDTAISELKKRGIKAAFQLNGKKSQKEPLYTIRRMIVPGGWSPGKLQKYMSAEFK